MVPPFDSLTFILAQNLPLRNGLRRDKILESERGAEKMDYRNCELCPRRCSVDRAAGERGWCGAPDTALVAKTMLHQWEEPVLSPNGRSAWRP